ncbi:hypothetical protein Bca4012_055129 [Brassica carinata]
MQAKPSFRHEIDPKPDAGFFKFYASVLGLDTVIGPTPTFFRICGVSYAKCSYRFDLPSLVNWLCSAGLNYVYVGFVIDHLNKALSEFVSSPVVRDRSLYMTCNVTEDDLLDESLFNAWLPTEESIHQSSFDEITNNMRDLSLSLGHEFDDWYVDMNNYFVEP